MGPYPYPKSQSKTKSPTLLYGTSIKANLLFSTFGLVLGGITLFREAKAIIRFFFLFKIIIFIK